MRRSAGLLGLVLASALALAACSSSPSSNTSSTTTTPPASTTTTTTQANATAQIRTNWETFFNGSTPASRRIELLQNGQQFAPLIRAQSSTSLAKSVKAKVSSVHLDTATTATVRYSLLLGGQVALANQTGQAVLDKGVWQVGDQSFCGLLALQQVKNPACPTPSGTS